MATRRPGWLAVLAVMFLAFVRVDAADARVVRVEATLVGIQRPSPSTANVLLNGAITTSSTGLVRYVWDRSDGTTTSERTLVFTTPGTMAAGITWSFDHTFSGWARLRTTSPNAVVSNAVRLGVVVVPPRVTMARLTAEHPVYQGRAPQTARFVGIIATSGPCNVTYTIVRSDGATGPVESLTFAAAGVQPIGTTWQIGRDYSGWVQVRVISPNPFSSTRAPFRIRIVLPARAAL